MTSSLLSSDPYIFQVSNTNEDQSRISTSISARTFKLCQVYIHNKVLIQLILLNWLRGLGTIYRPATK